MNRLFYPKLAASNMKKNARIYLPYILTGICTVIMFYIMHFISVNKGLDKMSGSDALKSVLNLGTYVVGLFAVIFLFYTNSFLMKQRKKEFGLFNILGMGKKHIAKIILFETMYVALITLGAGILCGILFSKLMFLLLLKMLHFAVPMGFVVSFSSISVTVLLFCIIYILTLLNNLRQIHIANPIELLKGGQVGEKEPKTKWVLALCGAICLIAGYIMALTTDSPVQAITIFFVAVILVIVGTYALFAAGSIVFLKMLRKKKGYYYQTRHFISVSGMIYRMKQNAVGLANICILSTMVLVVISTTVSLYIGMEDVLHTRYPYDIIVNGEEVSEAKASELDASIESILGKNKVKPENTQRYRYLPIVALQEQESFTADQEGTLIFDNISELRLIPLAEYNRMEGTTVSLQKGEVLVYEAKGNITGDAISVDGIKLKIKEQLSHVSFFKEEEAVTYNCYILVMPDEDIIKELYHVTAVKAKDEITQIKDLSYYYAFDTDSQASTETTLVKEIKSSMKKEGINGYSEGKEEARDSFYSIYGGLLFLGIFLGALFVMATVLIIYYKQVSEGYDDKARFHIMQQVGMSKHEVKKSIHSQVLTVFFLPLIVAALHIAFAFKMITKILIILNLTNVNLFAVCTVATILIFGLFYALIYALTAKVYYRIVS